MAIVLGLPKGSLQESTFALFKRAGFNVSCSSRSYTPTIDDEEIKCRLLRPQEMSRYVELGLLDAGICGYDWVYENGSDVPRSSSAGARPRSRPRSSWTR